MKDGTLERVGDHQRIRFERRLSHPVERPWSALTEPWLAIADLELEEGGRVVLTWQNTDDEGNTAVARGTVSALDPPRLLEFDTDIHGRLRWELEPDGDATALTFTAEVELPEEYETKVTAGWHIHLDHLEEVLDGGRIEWPNWDQEHRPDWERIHERYEAASARGARSGSPSADSPSPSRSARR
jgi:uncharacterized protein YndB with AHSA1/START domain